MVKLLRGKVVSVSREKTITVLMNKKSKDSVLDTFFIKSKKIHVHDQDNKASLGDEVWIKSTRPISKTKSFVLASIASKCKKVNNKHNKKSTVCADRENTEGDTVQE